MFIDPGDQGIAHGMAIIAPWSLWIAYEVCTDRGTGGADQLSQGTAEPWLDKAAVATGHWSALARGILGALHGHWGDTLLPDH